MFVARIAGLNQSLETQVTMVTCTNAGGRTKEVHYKSFVFVYRPAWRQRSNVTEPCTYIFANGWVKGLKVFTKPLQYVLPNIKSKIDFLRNNHKKRKLPCRRRRRSRSRLFSVYLNQEQGRIVQKPINANPRLIAYEGVLFLYTQMLFCQRWYSAEIYIRRSQSWKTKISKRNFIHKVKSMQPEFALILD